MAPSSITPYLFILSLFLLLLISWKFRVLFLNNARIRKLTPVILSLGMLALMALTVPYLAFAQGDPTLPISKSFGGTNAIEVESGEEFTYFINYRCASVLDNCMNAVITDVIPSELEFISVSGPLSDVDSTSFVSGTLLVDFVSPLGAGTTGIIEILVRFPLGTLPGTTADNTAVSSTDGGSETSETIRATASGAYEMFVDKTIVGDFDDTVIGSDFTTNYQLQVCNPDAEGGVRLTNPTIVDTLPPEATFISASNGGVYNSLDHTITWTAPDLPDPIPIVDGCSITLDVAVRFDENGRDGNPGGGDDPVSGATATNSMRLTGTPEDGSPDIDLVDPVDITFTLPSFGDGVSKSSTSPSSYIGRPTEELPGGDVTYTISYNNSGTITATNVILTDTIPPEVFVSSVGIEPVISDALGFFETNDAPGVWIPFPGNGYSAAATLIFTDTAGTSNPNDIELAANDYLTRIRWEIGEVPLGSPTWSVGIGAFIKPSTPVSTTFQNCVSYLSEYNDGSVQTATGMACDDVTTIETRAIPRVNKTSTESSGLPGTVNEYTIRAYNADVAHNDIEGPIVVADFLPARLDLVVADSGEQSGYRVPTPGEITAGNWYTFTSSNGAIAPTHTYTESFNAANDTLLSWEFAAPYSVPPGDYIDIVIHARVKDYTAPQQLDNRAAILFDPSTLRSLACDASDGNNAYTDSDDVDNDSNASETGCTESDPFNVTAFLAMDSEKYVLGELDSDYSDYGYTVAGGRVDYLKTISNTSNVTATNIIAYDIFPYIGDTGVIDPSPRDSEWAPHLISPITDTQGFSITIAYSQSTNPCRPEIIPSGPVGCVDDWSETPPSDITSVKAVRLDFCDSGGQCVELAPDDGGGGGTLTFGWDMVAPNGTPVGDIAWNSFGFSAEGGGLTLLPSEPIRVGIELAPNPSPGVDVGNFVWLDVFGQQNDGIQQPEEIGINGVRVELWDDGLGTLVDFRTTGPDVSGNPGYYQFNNVITGTYSIRIYPPITDTNGLPILYTTSIANNGGDDAVDSDGASSAIDPTYGTYYETAVFSVASAADFTWDQGFWLPTDYGDAPATYPTEAASQGNPADAARHIISPGISLGGSVDAELDGQPDAYAIGDDTNVDDEDGVGFANYVGTAAQPSGVMTIGEATSIAITATVPITGYLNVWIDYNQDGVWDPSEQFLDDELVTPGSVNYPITVPNDATVGTTYARFRLSTQPGLEPTGGAYDGEVEDYKVQILPESEKYLFSTSADHTSGSDVTIGEIITYHLEIPVPEGTVNTFVVQDNLPNRLRYVDTITPTVFISANTGITIEQFVITPGSFSGGTDPIFNFGTVTNQDLDADVEYINILLSAVVENVSGNQSGTSRNNRMTVSWDSGYNYQTPNVRVDIVEPDLYITKSLVTPLVDPLDAGATVTFEIVVLHTNDSDIDAKDVMITDTLPSELTNVIVDSVTTLTTTAPAANVAGNLVTVPDTGSFDLPLGDVITITVSADLAQSIQPEEFVSNTADLTWTSIEGPDDEERDGSGGIDDYSDSDSDDFTVDDPSVSKALVDTSAAHTIGNIVTIGEVVTYSVSITLPESTIPSAVITDSIPAGMDYIANSVTIDASGLNGSTPTISESGGAGSGDDVVFTLGSFNVISDNITTNNTIVLIYEAVVMNESANVGVAPYTNLTNGATVQIGSNPPDSTNQVTVTVEEPVLDITKSIVAPLAGTIDAGDTITYQIVLEHDGLSELDAFDVVLTDTLPAELTNVAVASIAASGIVAPTFDDTGNVVRVPNTGSIDLPFGAVITLTITADVAQDIVAEEVVTNRSNAVWSTLPGSDPNERDGGGDTPDNSDLYDDGALDDYEVTSSVPFTADDPNVSKALVNTSAAHTTGNTVTIGEVVTYSISINLPESTIPSAVIIDNIPAGMAYITNSVVVDDIGFGGTTPAVSDSNAGGSGDDVTFTLSSFTVTNDNNPANNTIALVYQAVVLNESANIGVNPPGYTDLTNSATVQIGSNPPDSTNPVTVTVEEPVLDITKSIVAPLTGPIDAGDTITYQIVLEHDSLSELDAFDVVLTDTLPAELTNVTVTSVEADVITQPTATVMGNTISISGTGSFDLPLGDVITVTITADVAQGIVAEEVVTNAANAVWSTLPGSDPNERDGGGDTPDNSDLYDDGALDDYEVTSSVPFTAADPVVSKALVDTSAAHTTGNIVTVGEVVTYSISITVPESTIPSAVIIDNIPAGMAYITNSVVIDASGLNGTTPTISNSNAGGSGDDVTFTLGSFTVTNDNNPANNTIVLVYQAVVLNESANIGVNPPGYTDLTNEATVQIGSNPPDSTNQVTVTVEEPVLDITKSIVAPLTGSIDAGDTITYQVVLEHDSLSELDAFDVVLTDTLPSSLSSVSVISVDVSGIPNPGFDLTSNTVTIPASGSFNFPTGSVITVTVSAVVNPTISPNQVITNQSNAVWSTLPGSDPNERDGGGNTPDDTDLYDDGALDDYETSSSVSIPVNAPVLLKSLINTSASHTAGISVTIGEVVTYSIALALPESVISSIVITDNLPAGLSYVTGTVALDTSSFNGTTPTLSESSTGGSGDDMTFTLGSFTVTNDNDPNNNILVLTYEALVVNELANVGVNPPGNRDLVNTADVQIEDATPITTDPFTVTVSEPVLDIAKTILAPTSGSIDAGDTITYQIVILHDNLSELNAYDVVITDTFPAELTNVSVDSVTASGVAVPTSDVSGNVVTVPATGSIDLPLGAVITLTLMADVDQSALPRETIENSSNVVWSTLDGSDPNERDGGGDTPDDTDIYDGGALDDYEESSSDSFTIDSYSNQVKALVATSAGHTSGNNVTIGEIVTYTISIELPESTIPSITIIDDIPAGMAYVTGTLAIDNTNFNGTTPTISDSSTGGSGADVTFNIGSFTVTNDNNAGNNIFAITYQVVVMDVVGNIGLVPPGQTDLTNGASVQVGSDPANNTNSVTVTAVEPQLIISKAFDREVAERNDTVTVTLRVTNTGTSTAFDVIIDDPIDNTEFVTLAEGTTPAGFTYAEVPSGGDSIVRYSGGPIAPGATIEFTFLATLADTLLPSPPNITNVVTVTQHTTLDSTVDDGDDSQERDEPDVSASDDLIINVHDLVLNKDDGRTGVKHGDSVTYTLTVTNVGNAIAPNAYITDTVPVSTTFRGPAGWTCSNGDPAGTLCAYALGNMAPGAVETVEFIVEVDSPLPNFADSITNSATTGTDGSQGEDPTPSNNTDDDVDIILASIGDLVWLDTNGDGLKDGPEIGVGGITVTLYTSGGAIISMTQTAPDGSYLFEGVVPRDVYVEFTLPISYTFSPVDQGVDDTVDSDPNITTGRTVTTTLSNGEIDLTWDAGIYVPASIGDFVWDDTNADGIQDGGELGIGGITVTLYASDNSIISTTVTAPDGSYLFGNLQPQDVYLEFTYPPTYTVSPQDQGGDDSDDSDLNPATNQTVLTTLESGENDLNWDAGLYIPATIGDVVWLDIDGDGVQDGGSEVGIGGVTVTLYASDDSVITTTVTAPDGSYLFDNLVPQVVYLEFSYPPTYTLTLQDRGGDSTDSDVDLATSQTVTTTLDSGENDLDWDAGLFVPASLGDLVWLDTNADGIKDGLENGIGGITVTLYASDNSVISTTVTAPDGSYLFNNLRPQEVYVIFTPPPTLTISVQDQFGDDTVDSDANPTTGQTDNTVLTSGENDLSWDAGVHELASLGDLVWLDTNGDGIKDGPENGIGGITVTLYASDNSVISITVTAPDGSYLFDSITPQDVYVGFTLPVTYTHSPVDEGSDDALDSDANPTTGLTINTTLSSGENDLSWDAGIYEGASIGDFVWEDTNGDGIQDGGELGIGGITVTLYASDNSVISTTVTAPDGGYLFDGLQPQDVYLDFTFPLTLTLSLQDQGSDNAEDSDVNPATNQTITTTLSSGENDLDWDAGLYEVASIGDLVWLDVDGDGIQDGGSEVGIDGITVTLYASDGLVITTTVTAPDGSYLFEDLVPQDVYLEFTYPPTYTLTLQDEGGDSTDSDVDLATGQTVTTSLDSGENDLDWDVGLYIPASLGDLVWLDTNADGIKDISESGVGGISVTLYASDGSVITTTVTAPDGTYLFDNLRPQEVYVVFTPPPTMTISLQDQGGNNAFDSDANPTTGQTINTILVSGENDLTWDAGVHELTSIGDFVWNDTNGNGIQDGGTEVGVGGITVTLYASDGSVITTTMTAPDGSYLFDDLTPQDVYVGFTLPSTYTHSAPGQGGNTELDSDPDPLTGLTITTTLSSGEDDLSWDAGIFIPASIGDYVWYDADNDGVQDVGEPGLFNITVTLRSSTGAFITDTLTAADGRYSFTDLPPGDYYIEVTPLAGYVISPIDQTGDSADSDVNGAGETLVTSLSSGENDPTWDAGLYADPAAIGDTVWLDADQDGVQDGDEYGIEDVVVNLYDFAGNFITTTTTAADGTYLFDGLPPFDYYVEVIPPVGYTISLQDQGGDDAADSDIDGAGQTIVTTLDPNETDLTWDAGLHIPPASLGDRIWLDVNQDGIQDPDEFGVSGVTVELYNDNGDLIGTTLTGSLGYYEFINLPPGDYYVDVLPPTGYTITPEGAGSEPTADSNIDPTTGETDLITLASGENNPTLDGGLYIAPAEIGNYVWLDADLNGLLDFNESGVSGVIVSLYDATGTRIDSTLTDPDGFYLFDNLPPGDYYVEAVQPNGFAFTNQDTGDDALDSDVDPATGIAITTTLTAGESDLTWDIGLVPANAELGDYVWEDLDGNGVVNVGEPAVPNVVVNLYDGAGNYLDTTTTDANGLYLFSGLEPGDYYVEFVPPVGFEFTTPISGTDTTIDSDADPVTGQTVPTTLTPGESDVTWDAGLVRTPIDPLLASLGDYVWLDENSDGLQGPQEPGVPNITVTLYDITGTVVATTTTDANGLYQFANLQPDSYSVGFTLPVSHTFTAQDVPADDTLDSDADPLTGLTITTTLTAGENDTTWDAGIIPPQDPALAAIGNFVWIDADSDGIQDVGEAGIEGVTVTLYDSGGVIRGITTTDSDGLYEFVDLIPGDYYVDFSVPTGYTLTVQNAGSDPAVDSDADLITGQTVVTTLVAGENDTSWDAGVTPILDPVLAAIGNFIWSDLDGDGVQDPGEPGVGSVQVNLYTAAGVLTGTTQTDVNGLYEFVDLIPGDYYVEVIPPFNMEITAQDTITDDLDSDADPVTGIMITTTLTAGENDTTWDAGLIPTAPDPLLAQLGNFVWLDSDQDGIQDPGEAGVPNIVVTLYSITNTVVATTTTDANGLYLFPDLPPADYVVEFDVPAVYTVTLQNTGVDPALDSDVDPNTGRTITTTLTAGEQDLSWDLGLYQPIPPTEAAFGNYVWFDSDQDGIQDPGESGVAGVTVILYDATNTAILTTTTDVNGLYEFTSLTPGDYHAEIILPDGHVFTEQGVGTDLGADSDVDADEASPTFGETTVTTLVGGENDSSWDAGIFLPTPPATASIGDFVWEDLDVDGIQDPGELGVAGVTVNLYDSDGNLVDTTITDGTGFYEFEDLLPGDYYVEVLTPSGYAITVLDAGSDELGDSDIDPMTGRTITTTLTAGENDPTWDAGLYQILRLGNIIWNDFVHDGVYDPGTETVIPGVVVELLDGTGAPFTHPVTGQVMTTTTDINGQYLFEGLPEGTYIVNIPSSNFDEMTDPLFGFLSSMSDRATDPVADADNDLSNTDDNGVNNLQPELNGIQSLPVTLEVGGEPVTDGVDEDGSYVDTASNLTVDFGFFELLTLGNQVWFDENGDGIFDQSEPAVGAGIVLYLLDGDGNSILDPVSGQPITVTTTAEGTYIFTYLYPGEYRVQIGPENFEPGAPLEGYASSAGSTDPDDDSDSDDNGQDTDDLLNDGIVSDPVTLAFDAETIGDEDSDGNNNTNLTVDFGLVLLPTAVELLSFTAERLSESQVQIRWQTGSEINNFGFRLLRSDNGNLSNATQVHFESSSVTSGPGAVYTFIDSDLQPGTYSYWLVDVETTGVETLHGPVTFTLRRAWTIFLPLTSR